VIRVLLEEFLGLTVVHSTSERASSTTIRGDDGAVIEIAEGLFGCPAADWLTERSLPVHPIGTWDSTSSCLDAGLLQPRLPVLYCDGDAVTFSEDHVRIGLDVFGTCFFMLTRYEEAVIPTRDRHGRFPAELTTAVRNGFLGRPIVDEYTEVLWACLVRLWPRLHRSERQFRVFSTHDVDHSFAYTHVGARRVARVVGGLVKRGRTAEALRTALGWVSVKAIGTSHDPWNTFDRVMDLCDDQGVECGFYFIPDPDPVGREPGYAYRLDDTPMVDLLRRIHQRGHQVGVHTSYASHGEPGRIRDEFERLRDLCATLDIDQPKWGGRAHYLRWDTPGSVAAWDGAGIDYDSTLGHAERPGFRCGVCRPFPMFDLSARRQARIRERPLIVMDATINQPVYLGLEPTSEEALQTVLDLREQCRRFAGEFVVLWHHNVLAQPEQFRLYAAAIRGASGPT
jgi:hypothetical protein